MVVVVVVVVVVVEADVCRGGESCGPRSVSNATALATALALAANDDMILVPAPLVESSGGEWTEGGAVDAVGAVGAIEAVGASGGGTV